MPINVIYVPRHSSRVIRICEIAYNQNMFTFYHIKLDVFFSSFVLKIYFILYDYRYLVLLLILLSSV